MKSSIKFLPILILHFFFILFTAENIYSPDGDELRYAEYADNILKGYYTESANPDLMNGPGYPIFLAPFQLLNLPPIVPKLFNSVFIFLSVFFLYKLLALYISPTRSLIFAYLLGLYLPLGRVSAFAMTESLTLFLLCAFMYYSVKYLKLDKLNLKKSLLPAFLLAYLVWTRTIFGYVTLVGIPVFAGVYLLLKNKKSLKFLLVLVFGFLFSSPFLIHNYFLTGRSFYWGTNGGTQLYWMTTQKANEYGNWFAESQVLEDKVPGMDPSHKEFYQRAFAIENHVDRNDLFLEKAKENIKNNPKAYLKNLLPSSLRLFFGYPNSYIEHNYMKIYFFLFVHIFFLVPAIFSLYPALVNRNKIPFEIIALMLFIVIYFGGTIMLITVPRYALPIMPFILLWLGYAYSSLVKISIR